MKKTSLLVAVPTLMLGGLLLSGCGIFRSHKAWETAKQESPLEIPPSLDRPSTSAALVIPPQGSNQPTANGTIAVIGAARGEIADAFILTDAPDQAYQRVGKILDGGTLGTVTAHDDTARSYTVSVTGVVESSKAGFFGRLFGGGKKKALAAQAVQVSVVGSGTSGSEVRAQGNAAAVAKVIDTLKAQLGG